MNFLNEMPQYFIGCDPDTRHAAYAVLNQQGEVVKAWTHESNGSILEQCRSHDFNAFITSAKAVAVVEGQQVYKDDKKSNPADLITLARSSGISSEYLSRFCEDIQIVLPLEWKGNRQKHAHQADILTKLGQVPVVKGKGDHRYCVPESNFLNINFTQYKHVIDAIGLAMWLRDSYIWEFKKRKKLNQ